MTSSAIQEDELRAALQDHFFTPPNLNGASDVTSQEGIVNINEGF